MYSGYLFITLQFVSLVDEKNPKVPHTKGSCSINVNREPSNNLNFTPCLVYITCISIHFINKHFFQISYNLFTNYVTIDSNNSFTMNIQTTLSLICLVIEKVCNVTVMVVLVYGNCTFLLHSNRNKNSIGVWL